MHLKNKEPASFAGAVQTNSFVLNFVFRFVLQNIV